MNANLTTSLFARTAVLFLLTWGIASAQPAEPGGVFAAGDLWETFLPSNVGKTYYENVDDPNALYHLFRVGNLDREWTTPTQMYPGGENLHIPWKQEIVMVEYDPDPNFNHFTTSSSPSAGHYAYGFHRPTVTGEAKADPATHWVDSDKRHQLIYEGRMPTNLGIDVKYRIRQWTLNHANMNDFIALELELTNTGVLDVDGDGQPERTDNEIKALVFGVRNEPINSIANDILGDRGTSGWFTGPTSGYDGTPDLDGIPWDVPLVFSGPSPGNLEAGSGPDGVPWAPDGARFLGNTMNRGRRYYYDIYTGSQWIAAKEGGLPVAGSSSGQADKETIYSSHPVGAGAQRGWFTSATKGYGNNDHFPWEDHALSMGVFYENAGSEIWDRAALDLSPDANWFDPDHAEVEAGNPLSFVSAVRPTAERSRPDGDMKYRGTFTQNWEKGNACAEADGSDCDWDEGYAIDHGFNGDTYVGVGPFSLRVGETMNLVLVEYGGFRLQGVRRARKAAQWAYERDWVVPEPPPTPDMIAVPEVAPDRTSRAKIKWDDRAEQAADFAGYKIYRSSPSSAFTFASRKLGVRLVDRYHQQTEEDPADEELAAFGVPNNPNISSDAYQEQTAEAWGPYSLVKLIPASELSTYINDEDDVDRYRYKFVDDSALINFGFTYYYYVAAFDSERGEVADRAFNSLETHRHNWNGRTGLWEGTYWWTTGNPFYPNPFDGQRLKDIGAPLLINSELSDPKALRSGQVKIQVLPNPYKQQALHDVRTEHKIQFVNLTTGTQITILDVSGQVVDVLEFESTNVANGTLYWDMFSKDGIEVTSGLYIFVAEYPGGQQTGHFAILR